jgi:uncharacterized membrane protein
MTFISPNAPPATPSLSPGMMESVEKSMVVEGAIWRVFAQWRRLENFPKYIASVREVRWLEKDRLFWREADSDGREHTFTFQIQFDLAQCRITWQSLSGESNRGEMRFEPQPGSRTLLIVRMHFAPNEGLQRPATVAQRLESYLLGFKKFVEAKNVKVNAG